MTYQALWCAAATLAFAGCLPDQCGRGDVECYLDHTQVSDENGEEMEMTLVAASALRQSDEKTPAPRITNTIDPFVFSGRELDVPVELDWEDPNPCQPSFCIRWCEAPEGGRCSSRAVCTGARLDGEFAGATTLRLATTSEAVPSWASDRFQLEICPVSSPDCAENLGDEAENLDVGDALLVDVKVAGPTVEQANL